MKTIKILSILFMILVFSACIGGGIKGEGPVIENNRTLANFNKIENAVGAHVFISKNAKQLDVKIKGQQNILDVLTTKVIGNKLVISFSKHVYNHERIEIFISIPEVEGLEVTGSGKIVVKDAFEAEKLYLTISGSGDIEGSVSGKNLSGEINGSGNIDVDGMANQAKLQINGSGNMKLNKAIRFADVEINGSGYIKLEPIEKLDVDINGSGTVEYVGNPKQVEQEVNGSGKIKKVN